MVSITFFKYSEHSLTQLTNEVFIMKKLATAILALAVSSSALASQVSPFQDNVTVNLNGFPITDLMMEYTGNNGVNISGPTEVSTISGGFTFQIGSQNAFDNGFPSVTIYMPSEHTSCTFELTDGPWTYLDYKSSTPPTCEHMSASLIQNDNQYQYHINLTYK